MEDINEKGCVYFFRHIGLTPVKIGYSTDSSPINRFTQFKTYAPYGSEIIGFIITDSAKKIETYLHKKFENKRLDGEWFEITEQDAINEIDFYSKKEDVYERNLFQIEWAKKIANKEKLKIEISKEQFFEENKFNNFKEFYKNNPLLNRTHTALKFKVSRKTIISWIKLINK
jgi:hypothetical protein